MLFYLWMEQRDFILGIICIVYYNHDMESENGY